MFATKIDHNRIEMKNKEFSKVDRFLTCRSLLFTKRKLYSILNSGYFNNIATMITQLQQADSNVDEDQANNNNDATNGHCDLNGNNNQIVPRTPQKRYKSVNV